jgi:hypothetical protein
MGRNSAGARNSSGARLQARVASGARSAPEELDSEPPPEGCSGFNPTQSPPQKGVRDSPSAGRGLFWYSVASGRRLMSGIHDQELGIWQHVQGNPQAGAGAAVGKCLAVRPVACERATPAMIHPLYY